MSSVAVILHPLASQPARRFSRLLVYAGQEALEIHDGGKAGPAQHVGGIDTETHGDPAQVLSFMERGSAKRLV